MGLPFTQDSVCPTDRRYNHKLSCRQVEREFGVAELEYVPSSPTLLPREKGAKTLVPSPQGYRVHTSPKTMHTSPETLFKQQFQKSV